MLDKARSGNVDFVRVTFSVPPLDHKTKPAVPLVSASAIFAPLVRGQGATRPFSAAVRPDSPSPQ